MARTRDVGVAIGRLLIAFNLANDEDAMPDHKIKIYEKGWADIPGPLLELAADRWIAQGKPFFPRVSEITRLAESIRQEILASMTFTPCAQCNETGWDTTVTDGITRVVRCFCWKAHQQKLAELGVTAKPLALPAAGTREMSRIGDSE